MKATIIKGAVALVTGANRGIGRVLSGFGHDVTDASQARVAAAEAADVEIVFNNAGVALPGGIVDATALGNARREMEVNFFGPLQLLQSLAPALARNGGGAIIYIGSTAALWRFCLGTVTGRASDDSPVLVGQRDQSRSRWSGLDFGRHYRPPAGCEVRASGFKKHERVGNR
jgi:NADP-dependent 3-hydroxy acid dehydrogenase YdfG